MKKRMWRIVMFAMVLPVTGGRGQACPSIDRQDLHPDPGSLGSRSVSGRGIQPR